MLTRAVVTFRERADDPHVGTRPLVLESPVWFPEPPIPQLEDMSAAELLNPLHGLCTRLADSGLVSVRTERALGNQELRTLAEDLGRPIPEAAAAVQPFVEDDVILNLVMDRSATQDADLQPFAENPITLHTESSLRAVEDQPKYLIFFCVVAPEPGFGGQTIIRSMGDIHDELSSRQRSVLSRTRYAANDNCPPILYMRETRPIFSFRDFARTPLELRCTATAEEIPDEEVRASVAALLHALYQPELISGIHWKKNLLVIVDNQHFFHGRIFGRGGQGAARRHLKRVRVLARPSGV